MLVGVVSVQMGVQGGEKVPKREGPGPSDRDRLRWEIMRREKFFWKAGDIRIVRPREGRKEAPREDDTSLGPGRG
jgi:hypothetical protein